MHHWIFGTLKERPTQNHRKTAAALLFMASNIQACYTSDHTLSSDVTVGVHHQL